MVRFTVSACLALLANTAFAQSINSSPNPQANDPIYQELNRIIIDQSNCLAKEAQSNRLSNVDFETAADTVRTTCATETQRYKVYMGNNFLGSPSEFEKWWNEKENETIEYVKKVIAMVRTQ
jgi:hypothetical protein